MMLVSVESPRSKMACRARCISHQWNV